MAVPVTLPGQPGKAGAVAEAGPRPRTAERKPELGRLEKGNQLFSSFDGLFP
jgi:hypothetical protein